MVKEPRSVADYLLYWKDYWKDVKNHPSDIDFSWHTARRAFFNRVHLKDNLWLVASVPKPQPAKWALVARVVVQRKRELSGYDRPFKIIGNHVKSQRFDYRVQSDMTKTLRRLQFASGKSIKSNGRAIGKRLQAIRQLTDLDAVLLGRYSRERHPLTLENSLEDAIRNGSAGFGDPETNRRVERAAICYVEKLYCSNGWEVKSREKNTWVTISYVRKEAESFTSKLKGFKRPFIPLSLLGKKKTEQETQGSSSA